MKSRPLIPYQRGAKPPKNLSPIGTVKATISNPSVHPSLGQQN
ncbi:hypothetical protein [Thermocoleostomius sinensis]|uniref:Uncharacterized protein n=1 Tax=Thermocoleostomius sinensis A174 TaxID=2016057 RepID=A0A9E9C8G3_9CYAN|nr:hypothetical protein [Thermocoleostomius sinensis]WAL61384.1 hypothetical protein OXH18_05160 [Thermocoleostomius sinensis A174]